MKNLIPDGKVPSTNQTKIEVMDKFIIHSLTNQGYDMLSAINELIDNGLDGGATLININYDKEKNYLSVEDNGCGMSYNTFLESMNLGSDRVYQSTDTGQFGIGMKAGLLNCCNFLEIENPIIKSTTFDGNELTIMHWTPKTSPRILNWEIKQLNNYQIGTKHEIFGCNGFYETVLKKNLGVIYYPTLKNNIVKIFVNGDVIIPVDPLYRDSPLTKTNYIDVKVCDEVVPTFCCYIDATQERSSWEGKDGWSPSKSGVYAQYGHRYIEYGNTSHLKPLDPWDSRTRIEFIIPKKYTSIFGVKMNKTNNISLKNPKLEELERSIKSHFSWAKNIRKKNEPSLVNQDLIDETKDILKNINKIAAMVGMVPPKEKKDVPSFKADPDKVPSDKKPYKEQRIREISPYEVRFISNDNTGIFWTHHIENNKFIISLNENHSFYRKIYYPQDREGKQALLSLLIPIGYIQYNTNIDMKMNTDDFWINFWSQVSIKINQLQGSL